MKIGVFGGGSWGTALAVVLAHNGHEVTLWVRKPEVAETMRQTHHNPVYLSHIRLPDSLQFTSDLPTAAQDKALWVMATPSQAVHSIAVQISAFTHPDLVVVSASKGIENDTLKTTTQVLAETLPHLSPSQLGVLYGPSHAEEVIRGMPTTVLAASTSESTANFIQDAFHSARFRVYTHPDLLGVEVAGSVKNVLAIAAGISDGVGYGDNTKAAIMTRGLAEIQRLGVAMGAQPDTFSGLAGLGDLVVTCMSKHSRNRFVGEQIGKGKTLKQVESEMKMIAEGVKTTLSVHQLSKKYHVEMPISEAVYRILFEDKPPLEAVTELMMRQAKNEAALLDG